MRRSVDLSGASPIEPPPIDEPGWLHASTSRRVSCVPCFDGADHGVGRVASRALDRTERRRRFEGSMSLRISGKNLDVGDAFRSHVEARLGEALAQIFRWRLHRPCRRSSARAPGFRTDCAIHLDTGIVLQATGRAQEAHQSLDIAADRIEKRLRRYKRRLKDHHPANRAETMPAGELRHRRARRGGGRRRPTTTRRSSPRRPRTSRP